MNYLYSNLVQMEFELKNQRQREIDRLKQFQIEQAIRLARMEQRQALRQQLFTIWKNMIGRIIHPWHKPTSDWGGYGVTGRNPVN